MRSTGSGLALMPSTTNCSIGYKTMTTTRKSPIAHLVADSPAPVQAALHHPVDMVKLGAKGPRLVEWAEQHALALPERIYDTRPWERR